MYEGILPKSNYFFGIPKSIIAGDIFSWNDIINLKETEILTYYFVKVGSTVSFSISATPNETNSEHTLNFQASESGDYLYQIKIETLEKTKTIKEGRLLVKPNLAALNTIEQSDSEKLLAVVEEAISTILSGGAVKSYEIGTRKLEKFSLEELISLRSKLRLEVAQQRRVSNKLDNKIHIRFSPTL